MLPYGNEDAASKKHIKFNKPKKLKEMIEIAKKLSSEFDYVRVDLYEVEGKIYFGEMTFYPLGGMTPYNPKNFDEFLVSYLKLPTKTPSLQSGRA